MDSNNGNTNNGQQQDQQQYTNDIYLNATATFTVMPVGGKNSVKTNLTSKAGNPMATAFAAQGHYAPAEDGTKPVRSGSTPLNLIFVGKAAKQAERLQEYDRIEADCRITPKLAVEKDADGQLFFSEDEDGNQVAKLDVMVYSFQIVPSSYEQPQTQQSQTQQPTRRPVATASR